MTCEHGCCQGPECTNDDELTTWEIAALLAEERRNRRFERYQQTRRYARRKHTIQYLYVRWGRKRPYLRELDCLLPF